MRGLTIVACLALAGATMAQERPLLRKPEPITFSNWHEEPLMEGGFEYQVKFPSPYRSGIPANDQVPLRIFLPEQRPCPVVIILHYWGAHDLRLERVLASELTSRGIGAALITLPYHLERTPPGARSGESAIQPDPVKLRAMVEQSVLDVRRTVDFLESRPEVDKSRIGISGVSLGAIVGVGSFAVEPRISRASFLLGGIDLAKIIWSSSRLVPQRDILRREGFTESSLREALATIEPEGYLPRNEGVTFVVGGKFDSVVPGESTRMLISNIPNPRVLWLDTGHYGGVFVQRRLMREVARFFAAEFGGGTYLPPAKLVAPTIRLGGVLTPDGVDLGVGVDVWQFDSKGHQFATLLATPRGFQAIVGTRLDRGLALGVIISRQKVTGGLFWSIVL